MENKKDDNRRNRLIAVIATVAFHAAVAVVLLSLYLHLSLIHI